MWQSSQENKRRVERVILDPDFGSCSPWSLAPFLWVYSKGKHHERKCVGEPSCPSHGGHMKTEVVGDKRNTSRAPLPTETTSSKWAAPLHFPHNPDSQSIYPKFIPNSGPFLYNHLPKKPILNTTGTKHTIASMRCGEIFQIWITTSRFLDKGSQRKCHFKHHKSLWQKKRKLQKVSISNWSMFLEMILSIVQINYQDPGSTSLPYGRRGREKAFKDANDCHDHTWNLRPSQGLEMEVSRNLLLFLLLSQNQPISA